MILLSPLALAWLGSLPALIWLWRFTASRHRTRVPSLAPFEHLVRRASPRRQRVRVNVLFWLQLLALVLMALALAGPALHSQPSRTVLMLLDTSASMQASLHEPSALAQATRWAHERVKTAAGREQFVLARTAPVAILTPRPLTDADQLLSLLSELSATEHAGTLGVAHRISLALAGLAVDETVVLTDEPLPSRQGPSVTMQSFGRPLANTAIVGLEVREPLCGAPRPASEPPVGEHRLQEVFVTVQNFSETAQPVTLTLRQGHRAIAQAQASVEASARATVSLDASAASQQIMEITLQAPQDALAVDNRVWLDARRLHAPAVVVASSDPALLETVGRWLEACPGLAWTRLPLDAMGDAGESALAPAMPGPRAELPSDALVITDDAALRHAVGGPALLFERVIASDPSAAPPSATSLWWLVDGTHPVGDYLHPIQPVSAALVADQQRRDGHDAVVSGPATGRAVVKTLLAGQPYPVISVTDDQPPRTVTMHIDPTRTPLSIPVAIAFFNSVRWLVNAERWTTTGAPLIVGPFPRGTLQVHRPDGRVETYEHDGGWFRYDATDRAGRYRLVQGDRIEDRLVNFVHPVESDLLRRVSTWTDAAADAPEVAEEEPEPSPRSMVNGLLIVLAGLMLVEWVVYVRKPTP